MNPPSIDEKDSDVCFLLDRNEVHYIIAAPPAYHASLDGFKDPTVQEAIDPKEMTINELKTQLMARGLPVSGKKSVLVKRLIDFRDNQLNFKGFFTELRKTKSAPSSVATDTCSTLPQPPDSQSSSSSSQDSPRENVPCSPSQSNSISSQYLSVKPVLRKETAIRPHELTVQELRRHLSSRGIPVHGKQKVVLATQLKDVLKEERKKALLQRGGSSPISSAPTASAPAPASSPSDMQPPTSSAGTAGALDAQQTSLCT